MNEKGGNKKTIKNNNKISKGKKTITLKFNNSLEIHAKNIYKEDSRIFNSNNIDIDKIRVSDKTSIMFFYEDGNENIPLKITLLDVLGCYNIFEGNSKAMNFKLDDNSLGKITDIFDNIGKILNIDLYHYSYDENNGITYLKTKVSDEKCFRTDKDKATNTISNEKTKYNCISIRVLLQIQSVYYKNNKDLLDNEDYHPQAFLQHCRYSFFPIIN